LRSAGAVSVLVDEERLRSAPNVLRADAGIETTPTGAAGLAGLLDVASHRHLRLMHRLGPASRVLLLITEGP
ncbi:MAG TPA: hypothetical protein VFU13_16555, partial [Steroidobacteraceae bacterium]|nr:hypothetical protein [Steroidobacteraceae bacterium]